MEKNIPAIPGASAHFGTDGEEYWAEVTLPTLDGATATITYKGSTDDEEAAPEPAGKLRPIGSIDSASGPIILYSDKRGMRYAMASGDEVLMSETDETYPFDPEDEEQW